MRPALLVFAALLLAVMTAPSGAAITACVGTSEGLAQLCLDVDWDEPAACARLDLEAPSGQAGTGTCAGT